MIFPSSAVSFLQALASTKDQDRQWIRFFGRHSGLDSLASHHFRVIWIAQILGFQELSSGTKVDLGKIVQLASLHDLAEIMTGDVDYVSRQYTERYEDQGFADLTQNLDPLIKDNLKVLLEEYEQRETLEAKIVKDADNLAVDFELVELIQRGHQAATEMATLRRQAFPDKLFTEGAKQMWSQIYQCPIHAWHATGGFNRFQAGDWQNNPEK